MKKILLISIMSLFISSCEKKSSDLHPDILKPNWDGIKTENLKFKIGDVVSIFVDKQYYIGVVMDFNQDEGGIWYGLCLSNYRWVKPNQKRLNDLDFFARKIPNGFNGNCIDSYDLIYLNQNAVAKNIETFANIKIDINKISIGALNPVKELTEIEKIYFDAINIRKQKTTACDEEILNSERIAESYLKINP